MNVFVCKILCKDFLEVDIGILGCNFVVLEIGFVCLVMNEGNLCLVIIVLKIYIVVMGMECIVLMFKEVDVLIIMFCCSVVGVKLIVYNIWLIGFCLEGEVDGFEDFYLVIVDNGCLKILESEFEEVLCCICCGVCLNICFVYC